MLAGLAPPAWRADQVGPIPSLLFLFYIFTMLFHIQATSSSFILSLKNQVVLSVLMSVWLLHAIFLDQPSVGTQPLCLTFYSILIPGTRSTLLPIAFHLPLEQSFSSMPFFRMTRPTSVTNLKLSHCLIQNFTVDRMCYSRRTMVIICNGVSVFFLFIYIVNLVLSYFILSSFLFLKSKY